jgi:hypothetical protein
LRYSLLRIHLKDLIMSGIPAYRSNLANSATHTTLRVRMARGPDATASRNRFDGTTQGFAARAAQATEQVRRHVSRGLVLLAAVGADKVILAVIGGEDAELGTELSVVFHVHIRLAAAGAFGTGHTCHISV